MVSALGATLFEFHRDLWRQKTRVARAGRLCLLNPVFNILVEHRLVTDRQTDRHRTTYTALA